MNTFNRYRFSNLKIEFNVTSKFISEKINVSPSIVTQWEAGKKIPSMKNVIKLAEFFNVSTDYLLGLTDEKQIYKQVLDDNTNDERKELINNITTSFSKLNNDQLKLVLNLISNIVKD
jgi:transcriptional regulator with XRE-family HTH domain